MPWLNLSDITPRFADYLFVDLRSPETYARGHLPGALNISLILDEAKWQKHLRAWQKTVIDPFQFLVDYSTSRMGLAALSTTDQPVVLYLSQHNPLRVILPLLLEKEAWPFRILEGGYEAFVDQQEKDFTISRFYCQLCGLTGVGKTRVLRALAHQGEQVIDLEQMAQHRGSVFGAQGEEPSLSDFHGSIWQSLLKMAPEQRIFIEQKGGFLGTLPLPTHWAMRLEEAKKILLQLPRAERLGQLLSNYQDVQTGVALEQLARLKSRLSIADYSMAQKLLQRGKRRDFAELLLDYYDQGSHYQNDPAKADMVLDCSGLSAAEVAQEIIKQMA